MKLAELLDLLRDRGLLDRAQTIRAEDCTVTLSCAGPRDTDRTQLDPEVLSRAAQREQEELLYGSSD